ncbi:hypothetical protein XENOCAPTIV_016661 [Xenoophorus captivus]|uniref:Uncharacterized protein n=1 Tax=Xenoophorus captivus TaxID=1517983 RepID=A0ABV0R1U5_9TELE
MVTTMDDPCQNGVQEELMPSGQPAAERPTAVQSSQGAEMSGGEERGRRRWAGTFTMMIWSLFVGAGKDQKGFILNMCRSKAVILEGNTNRGAENLSEDYRCFAQQPTPTAM